MLIVFWRKYSLLVWLGVILVLGFLATSLASFWVSRDQIRSTIVNQSLPLTGENIYSEIQKDVMRPTFISSLMANDTFLRDWILSGEKDPDAVVRYLKEVKETYGTVSSFVVSEKTHHYYYSKGILKTVSEAEPRDDWYFRVRDMDTPYEMNLDVDLANNDAITIFINYKVMDYEGNFIGAAGVGLTLDALARAIESMQQRFNRRIYFVNEKGEIISSGKNGELQRTSIHHLPGIAAIAQQIINKSTTPTQLEYSNNTGNVMLSSRFIPEFQWYLVVEQTEASDVAPIRKVFMGNIVISAGVTLLVLLISLYSVNRYKRRLENVAATDPLTGLLNRHALELIYDQAVHEAKRSQTPIAMILLDIDNFKSINDNYGHLAGDQVILQVARMLSDHLRDGDVLCRWGGEEYLILLKNTSLKSALCVAEKLRKSLMAESFQLADKAITGSFGVAEFSEGETLVQFFARADKALYQAKSTGRNRVETLG
jgi:diguanylate cyclase (GGDEF)-like protein